VAEAGTTMSSLVREAAQRRPEAPAVVDGNARLTWADLDAAVDRAAAGYVARGLVPGDRVAVQLPNGLAWLRAALGALRAGLVVVPVNTAFTDPELEYVLTDSGAALLVAAGERAPVAGVPVCDGPPDGDGPPAAEPHRDPAAPAFLAYTSGTTGRPRGAILTAGALHANQEQCLALDPPPVRADDRVLLVLPLFHVYGLNAGFGLVAATGACAVLQRSFDPRGSLALMAAEGITAVPGAPPMYQAWLAAADADGGDASVRP
jgi:long-chain acyl-CoA synthetase